MDIKNFCSFIVNTFLPNKVGDFCIDSRTCKPGDIFFAINGEHNDGHNFVEDSFSRGAIFAVVTRISCEQKNINKCVVVDDMHDFILCLVRLIFSSIDLVNKICITGSVGKTTTKYWLSDVLSKKYSVFFPKGNLNTLYGILISLGCVNNKYDIGVFEVGSSSFGEISSISHMLRPTVSVLLNVYESHIGNYDGYDSIVKEKISIVDGLQSGGFFVCNYDLKQCLPRIQNTIFVGFDHDADVFMNGNCINVFGKKYCLIKEYFPHQKYIICVICAILSCINEDIEYYLYSLSFLEPVSGRGNELDCVIDGKKIKIIDDSYNASPTSMMEALKNTKCNIAVIGQMLELGNLERNYHKSIISLLSKFDYVFLVCDESLHDIFHGLHNVTCFVKTNRLLFDTVVSCLKDGDSVLVKGSNSTRLRDFIKWVSG